PRGSQCTPGSVDHADPGSIWAPRRRARPAPGGVQARAGRTDRYPVAMSRRSPGESLPAPSRTSLRRGYLLAVVILVGTLLMVWMSARAAGEREQHARQAEFVAQSAEILVLLQQRLLHYELALRGGVSLYWSVSRPTERQWRDYVGGLDVENQFHG